MNPRLTRVIPYVIDNMATKMIARKEVNPKMSLTDLGTEISGLIDSVVPNLDQFSQTRLLYGVESVLRGTAHALTLSRARYVFAEMTHVTGHNFNLILEGLVRPLTQEERDEIYELPSGTLMRNPLYYIRWIKSSPQEIHQSVSAVSSDSGTTTISKRMVQYHTRALGIIEIWYEEIEIESIPFQVLEYLLRLKLSQCPSYSWGSIARLEDITYPLALIPECPSFDLLCDQLDKRSSRIPSIERTFMNEWV